MNQTTGTITDGAKMRLRKIAGLCCFAVALAVCGGASAAKLPVQVSSDVGTGFWMESFAEATNLAHQTSTPLVLFWANQDCTYCGYLEKAVNTEDFKTWQNAHADYIYCYVQGVKGQDVAPNIGANVRDFAKTAAGTLSPALTEYPLICLYWPQTGGKIKVSSFVGRTGKMPVSASGRTLAQEFEGSIEKVFGSYSASAVVRFRCGESGSTLGLSDRTDRLEAEPSTTHVEVPLSRSGGVASQTRSILVVEWPDEIRPVESNDFTWAALATNAYMSVDLTLPTGVEFPAGKRLALTLLDEDGKIVATNGIYFVDAQPNACTNPYWVGERTAETLGFSEWTHDYDIVREKAAAGNADYILALFSGTLWCPYCRGIEDSLFKSQEFKDWCEFNRVQVALFDQSQLEANGGGSQLLTYLPGVEHISGVDTVSGASYLSRHSLREDDADAVRIRDRTFLYSRSLWLKPETTSVRLGNPTLLLISRSNKVVGRFSAWRDIDGAYGHELGNKFYEPEENIARLNALLSLGGRVDERQDYASTTTNVLALGGSIVSSLQVNDTADYFLLRPSSRGRAVFMVADKTARRAVRLTLLRDGVEMASSTSGSLVVDFSRDDLAAKRIVLGVSAPDFLDPAARVGDESAFDAKVVSSFEPVTRDEAVVYSELANTASLSSYVVAEGEKVTISVVSGKIPAGASLKWDASASSVVLSGTPAKNGTFSFTYKVVVKTAKGKIVSSETTKARVTVASAAAVNPYYGKVLVASVPLYETDIWGVKTLSSVIQVSQTSKKTISAKRLSGEATSFSGKWKKVDNETGLLTVSLKNGAEKLTLKLAANGKLTASCSGKSGSVSVAKGYGGFAGQYTVTLPVAESTAWYYTFGTGYLTLKTSTANSKKGLVTYAGALPNGVPVSGSAYLGGDPKDPAYAFLPIYTRSSRKLSKGSKKYTAKDDLAAVLRIRADGKSTYADDEKNRIVLSPAGVSAFWKRRTSAAGNALFVTMSVYGGYYVPGKTLNDWLGLFGLGTEDNLVATVDGVKVPAVWSFSSDTGVLTGKAKAVVGRRTVTASFKGVVLPGWVDCGCGDEQVVRPFASGTFYYSSLVNGFSTPASLAFDLDAP